MLIRATIRLCVMGGVCGGRRGLSNSRVNHSRIAIRRMLLQEDGDKRHMNFGSPRVGEAAAVEKGSKKIKGSKNPTRFRNLNKVYLDKIADILSTGELASQLYGHGLELSKVCLQPNLQALNVYWISDGDPEQDQRTEEILQRHVRTVRQELSNLRILGHTPPIIFMRDDRYSKLQEVEKLLAIADFGEDFQPTNPAHHLKAGLPTLTMPLDTRIKTAIEGLEGDSKQEAKDDSLDPFEEALRIASSDQLPQGEGDSFELPCDLPTMRGDVLGVNTTKIYSLIRQNMKKAKAEHRKQDEASPLNIPCDYHSQGSMISPISTNRKMNIQQWASRYKHMQKKEARKQNKEAAMLRYSGNVPSEDMQEEEVEAQWVEEDYNDDLQ